MSTVVVIGAGAAGLIAALKSCEKNRVILIDGNDKCGKKLLLTGNGRCNYWNSDMSLDKYETDSMANLDSILSHSENVLDYLDSLGIYPRIKNGYYYPFSNQAASVREILQSKVQKSNIEFKTNFKVAHISAGEDGFVVFSADGKKVKCDRVILATGSKASPKTGSDGSGYALAKSLGHSINRVCPSLTGLVAKGNFLKDWEKIRCDAKVSLAVNGKVIKEDTGEIQLTSAGISGICTFNVSGRASKCLAEGKKVMAYINFMPHLDNEFYAWFDERCRKLKSVTVEQALESIFNYKLMFVLCKVAGVDKNSVWHQMSESKRKSFCEVIEKFPLEITGVEGFEKAQVCTGGVPLEEINPNTMESVKVKNLFFAGEILDADGMCGGYNLAFAFISGYIAGSM